MGKHRNKHKVSDARGASTNGDSTNGDSNAGAGAPKPPSSLPVGVVGAATVAIVATVVGWWTLAQRTAPSGPCVADIDPAFVNDDFCDCADGSDELMTAACGVVQFSCVGGGSIVEQSVATSMLGDGVCDCCDGSDEGAGNQCPNTCEDRLNGWVTSQYQYFVAQRQ